MLRLPLPLFIRSLYYLLNGSIIALSVCYVTIVSLQGFHCLSLSVCYVTALFYASTVPSSVYHVTILYLQCFHCCTICLLRHHTISSRFPVFHYLFTSLLCSMLQLFLALFTTSLYYLLNVSIFSLSVCYVSALCFDCLFLCFLRHCTISSRFPLFHYLFVTPTILSPQGFHCFIICLLRHQTIYSIFPLFHYLFVTSLL